MVNVESSGERELLAPGAQVRRDVTRLQACAMGRHRDQRRHVWSRDDGRCAIAGSQALQADALDFLGDTLTYGLSLYVIGKSIRARTAAALFKGLTLALMGLWVFGDTLYAVLVRGVPRAEIMGLVAFLALAANLACVLLLLRFRHGEANVRSVWLCSRNDAIGNVAVILAASGVWASGTAWRSPTWWSRRRWRVCSFGPQRTLPFRHCGNTASAAISSRKEAQ